MINLVLDGALFSESEMLGGNSHGMIRIAEEVFNGIKTNPDINISFANSIYSKQYEFFLKQFLVKNYSHSENKIISNTPKLSSSLPGLKTISRIISNFFSLEVQVPEINRFDIYHSFYYPFNNIIQNSNIKKSITYLDIIPLKMKGYNNDLIARTRQVVKSIKSNYAISISEFSKQDLLDYDKDINADRIFVAPLAASKELFFQNKNKEKWSKIKKKYNLPDKYFLSISSTDIRKNLPHLIKCFSLFIMQEKPKDLFLVITGNATYSYALFDLLKINKKVREKIIITDRFIDNEDLSIIYSNALCFFFISLYEGFGLPVLEAMQCGTPVVTSNTTSLPEVAGDAAILLNPKNETDLCNSMNDIYKNESLREKYSTLGLDRSTLFSWEKCTKDYVEIFEIIASN